MKAKQHVDRIFCDSCRERISRRTFFSKSIGCTAGLSLLAFPGMISGAMPAQGGKSKKEIFKELDEKVEKFLPLYQSCAIASFAALNQQFNLKADNAIPALMPFTGGLALRLETCGAVSGSLLAIGFFFEPAGQKVEKKAGSSIEYGGMFFERFEKEFGSTRCKGVQEHQFGRSYNFLDPEEQKLFMEVSQVDGKCMEVVKKAVSIAGDIILENS